MLKSKMPHYNVIIIGAGAAGLMCAFTAAKRQRSVMVLEHGAAIGEKIRISGGGRCNFTNIHASPANYISANPSFCHSALSRYKPKDFIALLDKHSITYHEKTLGQLFCDGSSKQIIAMLQQECAEHQVQITTNCTVTSVAKHTGFTVETTSGTMHCDSLVIATGGLSIPKMGATGFGYDIAKQFGLHIIKTRPGLVPLTLKNSVLAQLSGISVDTIASANGISFRENSLFTHKGLSGPAILQISSYLQEGGSIQLNLLPGIPFYEMLKTAQQGRTTLQPLLNRYFSKRLSSLWCESLCSYNARKILAEIKAKELQAIAHELQNWQITPTGTEGYSKAEVTTGGVDTMELSSKTMEANTVPGLFFIGEVVDVTGWLGGYNFQWAWSSAVAAGEYA